jgi:hypothetical protein
MSHASRTAAAALRADDYQNAIAGPGHARRSTGRTSSLSASRTWAAIRVVVIRVRVLTCRRLTGQVKTKERRQWRHQRGMVAHAKHARGTHAAVASTSFRTATELDLNAIGPFTFERQHATLPSPRLTPVAEHPCGASDRAHL